MVPVPPPFSSLLSKFLVPPQTQMIFSCTPPFQVKISCPSPIPGQNVLPPHFPQIWLPPTPKKGYHPPLCVFHFEVFQKRRFPTNIDLTTLETGYLTYPFLNSWPGINLYLRKIAKNLYLDPGISFGIGRFPSRHF